jgi:putative hydrolase
MDEPGSEQPGEFSSGDLFNEIPLFREIQRVLLAGTGPINWELARQVGIAMASWGRDDPPPTDEDQRGFEDTVRAAELHVAELTGMTPPSQVAPILAFRRAQWVEANIQDLKGTIEPAALRVADAFAKAQVEEMPEQAAQMAQNVLGQLSPLLVGAQAGTVLGSIGQRAFGQFDVALPRPGQGRMYFVISNIAQFERDWSMNPVEFRAWVALHEVAHRFELAPDWTYEHLRALVDDYVSTLQIDVSRIRERLELLDPSDPEALQRLFASSEGLFDGDLDPEQRLKLARIQAFMIAAEGYADHVTEALGRKLLSSFDRIQEAVARGREDDPDDPILERLLGIEMQRERYGIGASFCDRVAERADEATLARMWDSAEALPSMPELEEPTLWLSRMV